MNGAPAWGAVGFSWCVFTYIYIYVYRVPETQKMIQLRPWIGPRIAAHESLIFRREGEIEPKGSISGSLGHGKCDGSAFWTEDRLSRTLLRGIHGRLSRERRGYPIGSLGRRKCDSFACWIAWEEDRFSRTLRGMHGRLSRERRGYLRILGTQKMRQFRILDWDEDRLSRKLYAGCMADWTENVRGTLGSLGRRKCDSFVFWIGTKIDIRKRSMRNARPEIVGGTQDPWNTEDATVSHFIARMRPWCIYIYIYI